MRERNPIIPSTCHRELPSFIPINTLLAAFPISHRLHLHGHLKPLHTLRFLLSPSLISPSCTNSSLAMRRTSRRGSRTVLPLRERKPQLQCPVLKKLRKLKKIVPCCRNAVGLEGLLRRTAEYISFLELKVIVLKRILDLHGV